MAIANNTMLRLEQNQKTNRRCCTRKTPQAILAWEKKSGISWCRGRRLYDLAIARYGPAYLRIVFKLSNLALGLVERSGLRQAGGHDETDAGPLRVGFKLRNRHDAIQGQMSGL